MASGKQVPVLVGLLIYLCSCINKAGRKNFNTVLEMHGTAAALSYPGHPDNLIESGGNVSAQKVLAGKIEKRMQSLFPSNF